MIFVSFIDDNLTDLFKEHLISIKKNYGNEFSYFLGLHPNVNEGFIHFLENEKISYKFLRNGDIVQFSKFKMLSPKITNITMARLSVYNIFSELRGKKFVYIDIDTIFVKKINEKYIHNKENIAFIDSPKNTDQFICTIKFFKKKYPPFSKVRNILINKIKNESFFNAGILIINNPYKFEALIDLALKSKINYDDQAILNILNTDHVIVLNDISHNFQIYQQHNLCNKPHIIHLSGVNKTIPEHIQLK